MAQLVFIHGPGAGACAEGFARQLAHFPGSLAPTLPGHLDGEPCSSVERYTDWLRGWLWAQDHRTDLVLAGFTLGACIALQYALDYPTEVKGLVLMTVAMRSKQRGPEALEMRLNAAKDPEAYQKKVAGLPAPCHDVRGAGVERAAHGLPPPSGTHVSAR